MVLPRFIALRSARRRRKAGRARARSLRSRTRQPRRKALSAVCLNPRFRAREADVRSTDRTTVLKGSTAVIDAAEESLKIGFPIPSRSLQSNGATSHPDAPQVHAENRPRGLAPLIPAHGCPSLTEFSYHHDSRHFQTRHRFPLSRVHRLYALADFRSPGSGSVSSSSPMCENTLRRRGSIKIVELL